MPLDTMIHSELNTETGTYSILGQDGETFQGEIWPMTYLEIHTYSRIAVRVI